MKSIKDTVFNSIWYWIFKEYGSRIGFIKSLRYTSYHKKCKKIYDRNMER